MFKLCCDAAPPEPPTPQELLSARSPQQDHRKKTIHHLHLSLNSDLLSRKTYESIPDNELYLLGKEMPVFVKVKTRNRKKSYCTSSGSKNVLACEELIASILDNRVSKDEVVLNIGYDSPFLIQSLCSKAKMVCWVSEFSNCPSIKAVNLKHVKGVDNYSRIETLALFDSMDTKPVFTMKPQTQTIDYLIFVAFDKYIHKIQTKLKLILTRLSPVVRNFIFKLSKMEDLSFLEDVCYDSQIMKLEVVQFPDYTMLLVGEQVCSISMTEVYTYIRSAFYADKLCFSHQIIFDQVETEISKKGMLAALQTFNKKLSDKVFQEFLEHVALGFSIDIQNYME